MGRTLTLGRQTSYVDRETLLALGYESTRAPRWFEEVAGGKLGATSVETLDCSPYEGCSLVHDLNKPIPVDWCAQYGTVIDGGTLEHVFNFPVAIESCMRLLRHGGRFFGFTPANNCCGHGFYQFSPELYYRLFRAENGFEVLHLHACESWFFGAERGTRSSRYSVKDPTVVGGRVTLMTKYPLHLLVCARKIADDASIIDAPPQQSDYEPLWQGKEAGGGMASAHSPATRWWKRIARVVLMVLPHCLEVRIRARWERYSIHTLRNRRFAEAVDE